MATVTDLNVLLHRHGNRLDAANKQWHLQSPTPYDPPLTYSGWNQARATGQRIAQVLRDREAQDELTSTTADGSPRKRRRYQVIIHSSPFLRCVQTSIGISAGLASIPEPRPAAPVRASSTHSVTNPRLRPTISVDIPAAVADPGPKPFSDLPTPPETELPKKLNIDRTVLRLDAFLGEWLTPSYFEHVTPPPGSSLMLASAKANLLRKEDYANNPNFASYNNANAGQTTWAQSAAPTTPVSTLDNVSSLAEALRRAGRSDSVTSTTSNGESRLMSGGAYVAPVPTYAISHSAEIPNGYVPHARDNCCDVDYQWDSMRGTLDWGDGGTLGEEWPQMHKRFRKGLQKLVDWYATAETPYRMVTRERRASVTDDYVMVEDDDVEVESVVILVSHGAGCNALIGAITHAPVLTDVGLASLTQATRKPLVGHFQEDSLTRYNSNGSSGGSHPTGVVPIHESYNLALTAVSDHLSTGRSARAASVTTPPMNPSVFRGRLNSSVFASSPLSGNGTADNKAASDAQPKPRERDTAPSAWTSDRLGLNTTAGLNGGITVGSGVTSFLRQTTNSPGGLWSPLRSSLDTPDEDDDNFLPNFSAFDSSKPAEPATPKPANGARDRSDSYVSPRTTGAADEQEKKRVVLPAALPQLGSGAGGLWGSPRPIQEEEIPRDLSSPKRRWTVNERW